VQQPSPENYSPPELVSFVTALNIRHWLALEVLSIETFMLACSQRFARFFRDIFLLGKKLFGSACVEFTVASRSQIR
jgi:hypothetical protein